MKLYRAEYKYLDGDDVIKDFADFVGEDFFSVLPVITNTMNEIENCELTGIKEIVIDGKSLDIVNYVEPECNCPYCRANSVPLDMIARFLCPHCEVETVVAENGWELISCNSCSGDLYRHLLSYSIPEGKWHYTNEKDETNED